MIIRNFQTQTDNTNITLSADIQILGRRGVHKVYYAFDITQSDFMYHDATPYLAAFLLPAMFRAEDITVEGTVSEKFLDSTKSIMNLMTSWDERFRPINIQVTNKQKDESKPFESACFFSMGVDSFYTYLSHKSEVSSIKNLIFVHGFDIGLTNNTIYQQALARMKEIQTQEKVNIIPVRTNVKEITDYYLDWDWEHGGAMASIALLLRKKIKNVYFAGSDSWIQRKKVIPYGTHPDLDGLWSTEKTTIIHDGNQYTRLQKIQNVISTSALALNYLRVCNQNLKDTYNCSRCEKCIRTMIDLEIAGVLDKAKTFDHTIPLERLRKIHNEDFDTYVYFEDSLAQLKRQNKKHALQEAIEESLHRSKHPSLSLRLLKYLSFLDKRYNQRRIFSLIFKHTQNGDRTKLFKFLSKHSFIR